jgi:hypothetical protein
LVKLVTTPFSRSVNVVGVAVYVLVEGACTIGHACVVVTMLPEKAIVAVDVNDWDPPSNMAVTTNERQPPERTTVSASEPLGPASPQL